jgi:hypothetical protein
VLVPGAVIGAIAYGRPPERISPPDSVDATGLSYWLICIALLFEWEASAVRDGVGATGWHPSLTELINPLIAAHPVKSLAIVGWLLAGWALVRRLTPDEHARYHHRRLRGGHRRPGRSGSRRPAQG